MKNKQQFLHDPNCPEAYRQGWINFYGLKFIVTPNVLIPRFETEQIVNEVLHFVKNRNEKLRIVDIGTGSGCIAVSLAKRFKNAKIIATDKSDKALKIARQNAKFHKVEKQIKFLASDLLEKITEAPDIIVANLPYIPTPRIPTLDSSVKDFEPVVALDGGGDGFDVYRELFKQIKKENLEPKLLVAEIDDTHKYIALKEVKKYFPKAKFEIKKDFTNLDRILTLSF